MHKSLSLLILAMVAGCGGNRAPAKPAPNPFLNVPMVTAALAGQKVAVLPLTLALADDQLAADPLLGARAKVLPWCDSLINEALTGRAPEVTWVGPAELRREAARSAGLAGDPDHFGHAILRDPLIKIVPDPLRSQLRTLVALTDARFVLAPAMVTFTHDSAGVKAELTLVLADARTGLVGWRSIAVGEAASPASAFRAAMARVLPVQGVQ